MRIIVLFLLLFQLKLCGFSQVAKGFISSEAKEMMALCTSFTFLDLFGNDDEIIPNTYKKLYTSPVVGMDNKFQIYQNGNTGVINFRGSTDKAISWIENMSSAMIPAKDTMNIHGKPVAYCFGNSPSTAVHSGYALAIVFLSESILTQINALNSKGVYNFIITGHSQGGALAIMCRAYLENLRGKSTSVENNYKVYAFANPMCGNKAFAEEFQQHYGNSSFTIVNPKDPIPKMPINYEDGDLVTGEKIAGWINDKKSFDAKKLGKDILFRIFEKEATDYINKSNTYIDKLISARFGSVILPQFVRDINSFPTGSRIELNPFPYPKIPVYTRGMSESELRKYRIGDDGKWYRKEPGFFQHNPYNYYVGTLASFFPKEHKKLKRKYLEANL